MPSMLLINPPRKFDGKSGLMLGDDTIPIGLFALYDFVKRRSPKTDIEILDVDRHGMTEDQIRNQLGNFNIYGLTSTFPSLPVIKIYIEVIRNERPESQVVLGGPSVTLAPEYHAKELQPDFIVSGEGEWPVLSILDGNGTYSVQKYQDKSGIPILRSTTYVDLNEAETPLELWPIDLLERGNFQISTKRGCLHGCIYCSSPSIWGHSVRSMNPEKILHEITIASYFFRKRGYRLNEIHFLDDDFTSSEEDLLNFSERLKKCVADGELYEGIRWRALSRADIAESPNQVN